MRRLTSIFIAALCFVALVPLSVSAQSWKDLLKEKAKEKAAGIGKKSEPPKAAEPQQQDEEAEEAVADEEKPAAKSEKPGEGAWANYDFVRGEKVLFAEDFSKDRVGNFPKRLELDRGNMEVIEWKGQRLLRALDHSAFSIVLPQKLPERFTIEFDLMQPSGAWGGMQVYTIADPKERDDHGMHSERDLGVTFFSPHSSGLNGFTDTNTPELKDRLNNIRISVDGDYMKAYVNEKRVVNAPRSRIRHTGVIQFYVTSTDDEMSLIGNLVVAAGGTEMYDAIVGEGRYATQGILFDTGSDRIRPESTPTLTDIGTMLKEHPELKLTIEGHTDNVGDPAANKSLSARRAEAVKSYLVSRHGVDGSRLSTAGFGDAKPSAPNTSAEGRQQNRRVELVKM